MYRVKARSTLRTHSLDLHPLSRRLKPAAQIPAYLRKVAFPVDTIRPEVLAFVQATELLLSPIMLGRPLNEDERDMVAMCAQNLAEKYPVSLAKPTK